MVSWNIVFQFDYMIITFFLLFSFFFPPVFALSLTPKKLIDYLSVIDYWIYFNI
jgi:hypothetical protein